MVLAAQAFTALIPLLILAAAFAPDDNRDVVSDALIGRFHLQGSAAQAVRQVFTHSGATSTGVFSVVLLLLSAMSLTRIQTSASGSPAVVNTACTPGSPSAELAMSATFVSPANVSSANASSCCPSLDWSTTAR